MPPLSGWFIFLGAAVGVRENYHLGFDVLLYVLPKGSKKVLRTISDIVVLGFAIGLSRIALNVHFVTDVLAGWCLGLAWLAACLLGREALRRR